MGVSIDGDVLCSGSEWATDAAWELKSYSGSSICDWEAIFHRGSKGAISIAALALPGDSAVAVALRSGSVWASIAARSFMSDSVRPVCE